MALYSFGSSSVSNMILSAAGIANSNCVLFFSQPSGASVICWSQNACFPGEYRLLIADFIFHVKKNLYFVFPVQNLF